MHRAVVVIGLMVLTSGVYADVQSVEIGGELRIRGRWWHQGQVRGREIRIPAFFLPKRAIGPFGTVSRYVWDDSGNDRAYLEQGTTVSARASFTNDVSAFIELEGYEIWGEDFRSDYRTGADMRAITTDDVEVSRAYIQLDGAWEWPLRIRIGRQNLKFGKAWLSTDHKSFARRFPHDGVRLTLELEDWTVDGWWTKSTEGTSIEEDGDVDFSGIHATFSGFDPVQISGYWMWIHDARSINDTNFIAPLEWVEDAFGLDDYDVANLHTVGTRVFGETGSWDYDLELAYQFGEGDHTGVFFKPFIYGDTNAEYDTWAGDVEVGYRFDEMPWSPRVFLGGAYFKGEDNRGLSLGEWLNPFDRPEASLSFNRVFSSFSYTDTFDNTMTMSNFYQVRGGAQLHPRDNVTVEIGVARFWVDEVFDLPLTWNADPLRVPVAPALPFLTRPASDDIGVVAEIHLTYWYSEDVKFQVGWEHLFTGQALEDGNFLRANGLEFMGGTDDDDADYLYWRTILKF